MSSEIVVSLVAFCGTLVGSLGGIMAANRLSTFRIERLEEKVNKHNSLIERTYELEGRMNEAEHDIRDLKGRAAI